MPSDNTPADQKGIDVVEHRQEAEPDFFSLFSVPAYEDGINFGSSITSSIRRPMSAMMGGIFAVVDTALAVINEEFHSPEDSLMSSSSNQSDVEEQRTNNDTEHNGDSKVNGCCRRTRRTKTSKMGTNSSKVDASSTSNGSKKNNIVFLSDSGDVLMQSSIIGSISKLEVYGDINAKEQKKVEMDAKITDNLRDDLVSDLETKVDSSEYFIVEAERETNDGWLVVIDQ